MAETKTILVDAETVKDIALKNAKVDSLKSVLEWFLIEHKTDGEAVKNTIRTMNDEIASAQCDFDQAKNALISEFIPEQDKAGNLSWSLDYYSNMLTYETSV